MEELDKNTIERTIRLNTNLELIEDMMDYSPYGALSQMFIMDAINQKIDSIILHKEEHLRRNEENEANGKRSIINVESWIGVAEDLRKRIDTFHDRHELKNKKR